MIFVVTVSFGTDPTWTCDRGHICHLKCFRYLTFRGPRIVIYSYNRRKQDALFLKFILVKNSTCFGQTYCPSSGVLILYSQQLVFVIVVMLTVC
jgi:hypothetical protein